MSQHDFNIANQTFPSFRADLNDALQAAATISAGASAPTTPYAYQLWFDTSTNTYKVRNAGNSAWISLFGNDLTNGGITFGDYDKATFGDGSDLQIYHDGLNSYIKDAGTGNFELSSNGDGFYFRDGSSNYLMTLSNSGAAQLYYNGSGKLATTATGVDVTGTVTATTFQANAGGTFTTASGNDLNIVYPANRSLFIKEGTETHVTVDNTGNVLVGTASASSPFDGCKIAIDANSSDGIRVRSSGVPMRFIATGTSTFVGSISTTASATSYNTSSDYRLKENVVADWDATTRLKQLNPVRFNFIADPDTTVDGFLAHEVQSVVPEAITGTHNEVDDEGNPVYQGIDQSKLVPLLVKTIQELEARITALETN